MMRIEEDASTLYLLCEGFRKAVDRAWEDGAFGKNAKLAQFREFPTGCCGLTSDVLGQYLTDLGIASWYVCGSYYPDCVDYLERARRSRSHAWLTNVDPSVDSGCLILDITGDQFAEYEEFGCFDEPVYVGPRDRFHAMFEFDPRRDVWQSTGIYNVDGIANPTEKELYRVIRQYL